MNMNEIKTLANERGVKCGKLNKTELVRAIQRQEGNCDCFKTEAMNSCGQDQCLWRTDCN